MVSVYSGTKWHSLLRHDHCPLKCTNSHLILLIMAVAMVNPEDYCTVLLIKLHGIK